METIFKQFQGLYFEEGLYRLDEIISDYSIEIYNADLLSRDIIGYLAHDEDTWVVGVDESLDAYVKRFVIAHQLGHYFLHRTSISKGAIRVDSRSAIRWRVQRQDMSKSERESFEANAFAAELLMPQQTIYSNLSTEVEVTTREIESLSRYFGSPVEAVTYRLIELGYEVGK